VSLTLIWRVRMPSRLATRAAILALALPGCDNAYPEVVVVNAIDERVVVRDVSFNGCLWSGVLAFAEATSPQRCPPGSDRVHFKKFDAAKYCQQQAQDGTIDGIGACDAGVAVPASPRDPGLIEEVPLWFNYQTLSEYEAQYGDFKRIELTPTNMEQDFSVPGPYGH